MIASYHCDGIMGSGSSRKSFLSPLAKTCGSKADKSPPPPAPSNRNNWKVLSQQFQESDREKVKHTGIGAQLEAKLSYSLGTGSGRPVETVEIQSGRAGCPLFDFLNKPQNHNRNRGRITARRQSAQPNSKNCLEDLKKIKRQI